MRVENPVQFPGETAWEALTHHESFDIEEEDRFYEFARHYTVDPHEENLTELTRIYENWRQILSSDNE